MNTITNPETIKRAQELVDAMKTGQQLIQQLTGPEQQTQQPIQQPVWYNHFTCTYGEIIVPQNIVLPEMTINAIRVLLDAYAHILNCRLELYLNGYTDENNMRFLSSQFGIVFIIDNGKISIIRN